MRSTGRPPCPSGTARQRARSSMPQPARRNPAPGTTGRKPVPNRPRGRDNGFAISVPLAKQTAAPSLAHKAV
ncbi:hypothetical protein, partial [Streptomyces microflavus]|uniref:hypothetical protein n=1 Tax=Streptomyces microflavus TaxID=1919 RepID=UPI0033B3BE82